MWDLVRYFRSLRGAANKQWLDDLKRGGMNRFSINPADVEMLEQYLRDCSFDSDAAFRALRDEDQAVAFCSSLGAEVGHTTTQSSDHHQASKALVAAVGRIARDTASEFRVSCDDNPQRRAIWVINSQLHVTARNLDGVIPSLSNPTIIWEIKEYWGKTGGGSKMSDAVYECNLVGLELRHYEGKSRCRIQHVVFLDGRTQWGARRSDMTRFIDLFHQGLIDELFVGSQVETEWRPFLRSHLSKPLAPIPC